MSRLPDYNQLEIAPTGLNSRGHAALLRNGTPAVPYRGPGYYPEVEPRTVEPQQIFHDYHAVGAQRGARYATPPPLQLQPDANKDAATYSDEELNDSDIDTARRRPPSSGTLQLPHPSHSHSRPPTTPTKNRRASSSSYSPYPATTSPNRPVTRRWAAETHQDINPDRPERIPGANLRRQIDVPMSHLKLPSLRCTYVHPITKERCTYSGPWVVNWTEGHDWHWLIHVAKEYRLMVRKTLGMGQGTIIRTKKLFEDYRSKLSICDICDEGFSRENLVAEHKHMVHGA
ncbi:hypothetical protein Clacol_006042 [Clathrus columnatus]|uniref:C2H2-type domain-containing protein n=1 Tax=Clathrus columnatus TaxID=1419009 RepID=A0AAV5AB09_9AGAM|nr:hypothetical protein Clacol_006042 [Clathrus columnatus]